MDGKDNKVSTLAAQLFRFRLHQFAQVRAGQKIEILAVLSGNRVIAVTNSADNADLHTVHIHHHGALTVVHPAVGRAVINIDGKERKFRHFLILDQLFLAPVEFMTAHSHGGKVHLIHPFGDDQTAGQIGFGTALPHIAGGKQNGIPRLLCIFQIGGKLIHTGLGVGIRKLAVKIVDGKNIQNHQLMLCAFRFLLRNRLRRQCCLGYIYLFAAAGQQQQKSQK